MAILKNLARPSTVVGGAQTPNKKGSGFTNLNRIIQSNKDNKLSSAVAGGIQQTGQQVQEQTQEAQQKFQEEAQKSRLDTQEAKDKRSGILGRFGQPQQTQAQTTGVNQENLPNQQQPIVSEDEIKDFTRFRTGTYTGPKELENLGSLQGKAAQAEQVGDLARSTGGRQELLRRFVGGEGYTQGQQRLDTTLLGQSGQEEMNRARRGLRTMEEDVARAGMASRGLAQEYVGRAKEFGQETGQMIQQTRDPISTGVDTRLSELQKAEAKRLDDLRKVRELLGTKPTTPTEGVATSGTADTASAPDQAILNAVIGTTTDKKAPPPSKDTVESISKTAAAIDAARRSGILSQADMDALLKENLFARSRNLGLDVNQIINERIQDAAARNLTRTGVATDEQRSQLSALDRLAGRTGSDIEFNPDQERFQEGRSSFNLDSLRNYIKQSEDEKARQDAAFAASLNDQKGGILERLLGDVFGAGESLVNTFGDIKTYDKMLRDLGNAPGKISDDVGGGLDNLYKDITDLKTYGGLGQKAIDFGRGLVGGVTGLVGNIFCFTADTEVCMADGKYKKVKDLKLDDEVALGGKITAIGQARNDDLYDINGVKVSGGHALFYNGKWMRAKDVPVAYPVGKEEKVYPISTELHLLVTEGQVWADMEEVSDTYNKTDDEIIEELNSNKARNHKLMRFTEEYFGNKKIRK